MAFYVRTPWLSVNSGTDVVRSGTRDVRRQFRDCPGHSGTVGNPGWYGHVLRRYNDQILPRALDFEVIVKKGRGVSNMMRKTHVEEHNDKIRLKKEYVIDRTKWRNGVYELSRNVR